MLGQKRTNIRKEQTMARLATKTTDQAVQITLSLLQDVFSSSPPRNVAVRLWDGTTWKPESESGEPTRCTLVLQHPGALRLMFLPPSDLNLGEAYIYNDFDIEGEIEAILPLMEHFIEGHWGKLEQVRYGKRLLSLPKMGQPRPGDSAAKVHGLLHSKERDRQATNYHYDRSNEFFALWLDARMNYSCAYFAAPDDDLETAQERKLDYLCRKLRLRPGERLLDIGCGWGGLLIYAAQHYGVEADGITLSPHQAELARERIKQAGLERRCHINICDYREVNKPGSYDKLVSVSMVEHVGEAPLPTYFKCAWELLRPGGVFLNHGIGIHATASLLGHDFVQRYVFPDGECVPISSTLRAAEGAGFEVRDVENLKDHYVYTLRYWIHRLEGRAEEAKKIASELTYRVWRLYLAAGLHEFNVGTTHLYQTLLVKSEKGRSGLPLTREDWYA
jgi:cyclopropane-fatty-acyl-phospholipid synthase